MKVCEYLTEEGRSPFADWFNGLLKKNRIAATEVQVRLARIEEHDHLGDCRNLRHGVVDLRINKGPGYRIYVGREGDTLVILLCGGTKKRQQRDIDQAYEYWKDYKSRKAKGNDTPE